MARFDKARWKAVTPLLEELLDASDPQRGARLEEIRAEDPVLATDLASLLALRAQAETKRFLEGSAYDSLGGESALAGRSVGSYKLVREIGAGGMGSVWLAVRADGRYEARVAVKLLNLALLGREGAERFHREGNALARLSHPNIAHLLDAGAADGQPFLVLDYVEGQTIDWFCDSRALDVGARINLFRQVLAAVSYAHSQLILHRDLKPSNILVTASGTVKLLDFGIAKLLDDESGLNARGDPTQLTGRAFTPAYAAPEQAQGASVSTATDVYALGVLLYVLLAGSHPTAAADSTPIDRMRALLESEPVPMSAAARRASSEVATQRTSTPGQLARALRGDLENIVARALKKSPAERYPTVDAFAEDLRRFLDDEPVSARPDSVAYRAAKFVRRHRLAVIGASVATFALLTTSAVAVWEMLEARRQSRAAEEHATHAASSRDFLHFVLTEAGATGHPFTTPELLARAESAIEGHYGSLEHPLAIEQLMEIGILYSDLGNEAKALELAQTAHRMAIKGGSGDLARQSACSIGWQLNKAGQLKEAADLIDQTIAELRARPAEKLGLLSCLVYRNDLAVALGDIDAGVRLAKEAATLAADSELKYWPSIQTPVRTMLAITYRAAGQVEFANDTYRDLDDLFKRQGRERSSDAVIVAVNWSKLRFEAGDILGAAKLTKRAFEAGQAMQAGGSPGYHVALSHAQKLIVLHHLDEAQRFFSAARSAAAAEGAVEWQGMAMLGLASVSRERGDLATARSALQEAGEFLRAKFPTQDHRSRRALLLESGRFNLAAGLFAEAKAVLTDAVSKNASTKARSSVEPMTIVTLAQVEQALGDGERAATLARQASESAAMLALAGEASYWVGYCLLVRSEVEKAAGHLAASRQFATQALGQLSPTVGQDHPHTQAAQALAHS